MKVAQGGPMMMNSGSNANKTDDKETVEVEVEMKAIEEANELNELKLKMKLSKSRRRQDGVHVSPLPPLGPLTQLPAQKVKGNIVRQSFQKLVQKVLGPDQHE